MQIRFLRAIAWALMLTTTCLITLGRLPGHAKVSPSSPTETPDIQLATAAGPPRLVTEILNGESISVLYLTRADDQVLVRCYPTYLPTISLRAMGRNPEADDAPKEGVLSCAAPSELPQFEPAPSSPAGNKPPILE